MENELALRESRETYDVYFLGIVPDINMGNSWSRDKEAQLVDRVEEAQVNLLVQVWDTIWIAIPEQTVWTQIKLFHLGLHLLPLRLLQISWYQVNTFFLICENLCCGY